MRVTFDFDSTLDINVIQDYAEDLIDRGFDVWVITTRNHAMFSEVKDITEKLKIPPHRVLFTCGKDKVDAIKDLKPIFHLDDDWHELGLVNKQTDTVGVSSFGNKEWRDQCEIAIEEYVQGRINKK